MEERLSPDPDAETVTRPKRRGCLKLSGCGCLTFVVLFALFYWWQPWEYDLFPRAVPEPNPPVDPDSAKLHSRGTRIAVVVGHPDDPEFYIGGTLTKLAESGAEIHLILVTDGDKAYYPFEDHEQNRRVRQAEQREASATYAAKELVFLGYPDGRVHSSERLTGDIAKHLQRIQPDYLLTFDPLYPPKRSHADHRRSGEAAVEAAKQVKSIQWTMLFSTRAANYVEDISDYWDEKRKLLAIHESQFYGERLTRIENMVGGRAKEDGKRIEAEYGEGFRVVRMQ